MPLIAWPPNWLLLVCCLRPISLGRARAVLTAAFETLRQIAKCLHTVFASIAVASHG